MILLLDNFDSFTYNLVDYIHRAGAVCEVIRNNVPPSSLDLQKYSGLMISPGPETPQRAGYLMKYFSLLYDKLPVLGICLGHQAIGVHFGAELIKAIRPMHGKLSEMTFQKDPIFEGCENPLGIVRYNSLVLTNLPEELIIIAQTTEDEVMGLKHALLPIWGLQFHPEAALTQNGLIMLKNWIRLNKIA